MLSKLKRYDMQVPPAYSDARMVQSHDGFYCRASEVDAHIEESEKAVRSLVEAVGRFLRACERCAIEYYPVEKAAIAFQNYDEAEAALRESLKAWEKA